jgi:hypothetical protein
MTTNKMSKKELERKIKIKEYQKEYRKKYYANAENRKKKIKSYKKWYKKNKIRIKKRHKEYNKINKDKIKANRRKWWLNNHDKVEKQRDAWNKKNEKKLKKWRKKYYRKNKERILIQIRRNIKERLKNDVTFRLLSNLRRRVRYAVKANNTVKSDHTMSLIGCSIENLKKHLELHFDNKMSWDNYGKWHIDHIIPCYNFDLTKPEEQRKCFNWSNLQPLWAKDNLSKNRYDLTKKRRNIKKL